MIARYISFIRVFVLNASGLYRMILPAMELNKSTSHRAIIADLHKWDFTKDFDDYEHLIDPRLIEWADYVVLPALFSNVDYIIDTFLQHNRRLQFVMDIDCYYHALPEQHPSFKKLHSKQKQMLLSNMSRMDILTAPNRQLLDVYKKQLKEHYGGTDVYMKVYPNVLSSYLCEGSEEHPKHESDTLRIGLMANPAQSHDLALLERPLKVLAKRYGDKLTLILFGWSEKEKAPLPEALNIICQKPVPITQYFQCLHKLQLDIALLPLQDIPFNTVGKSFHKYLEYAIFRVPVVASDRPPYRQVIREGENGFLAHDEASWIQAIRQLIENKALRKQMGDRAFSLAWKMYSYHHTRYIEHLQNLFR